MTVGGWNSWVEMFCKNAVLKYFAKFTCWIFISPYLFLSLLIPLSTAVSPLALHYFEHSCHFHLSLSLLIARWGPTLMVYTWAENINKIYFQLSWHHNLKYVWFSFSTNNEVKACKLSSLPLVKRQQLKVQKMFRRTPRRSVNVLCIFNLHHT